MFIARVGRENLPILEQSLFMMTELEGTKCRYRVLHVGGTLDKIETQYKQMSEKWLEATNMKLG